MDIVAVPLPRAFSRYASARTGAFGDLDPVVVGVLAVREQELVPLANNQRLGARGAGRSNLHAIYRGKPAVPGIAVSTEWPRTL